MIGSSYNSLPSIRLREISEVVRELTCNACLSYICVHCILEFSCFFGFLCEVFSIEGQQVTLQPGAMQTSEPSSTSLGGHPRLEVPLVHALVRNTAIFGHDSAKSALQAVRRLFVGKL